MSNRIIGLALLVGLAGCTATGPTEVTSYRSPVDEDVGIRNTHYRSVIGNYNDRKPTDPKSWRQLNDEQSPSGGSSQ